MSTDVLRILLVEDDDGDAILVEELLSDASLKVELHRATTLDHALDLLPDRSVDCVLLDLGLPDSVGLSAVERLRAGSSPPALVVLTGHSGIDLGVQAVAAGADDYLVKGEVDGDLLGRSVRYAVQRRKAEEQQRALYRSEVRAAETRRLERALLPTPLVGDERLSVMVGYVPGGNGLLGGDFYDAVERPDGSVLCVIGDVAGHGPDEAALGATLRTAWRTIVLTDAEPAAVLPLLERVLVLERARPEVFVTLCQVVIDPHRRYADVYLAGHLAPLLLRDAASEIAATARGRALGIPVDGGWAPQRVELGDRWALVLYTDGLVEATLAQPGAGHADPSAAHRPARPDRLGTDGLRRTVDVALADGTEGIVERVIRRVRDLHGGPLADDAALLVVGRSDDGGPGERTATLADSDEWSR
ncbi:PP2C family protein-serine/threonine phosphatase [Cellulosimicrobium sp. CUA-896]|uniref:PP2C family protein-serine/threonine phosphatase n=1 Tax=Cellulosimicrobium sp. CUA-896 TaxID=1517881 RepID=UPI000966E3A7|nr:fused response regulator/phosphatase [Cellulosimicrobium sp. CUA-896]OLT46852.1 serine/threonine protein phosphatase [Cellulosimicrobium sp. CUA-896]